MSASLLSSISPQITRICCIFHISLQSLFVLECVEMEVLSPDDISVFASRSSICKCPRCVTVKSRLILSWLLSLCNAFLFFFSLHDCSFWKQSLSHVVRICVCLEAIPLPGGSTSLEMLQEMYSRKSIGEKKGFPLWFEADDIWEWARKRVNPTAGLWKQHPKTTTTVSEPQINWLLQARLIKWGILASRSHYSCTVSSFQMIISTSSRRWSKISLTMCLFSQRQ